MSKDTPVQKPLADLFSHYLRKRAEAQSAGLAGAGPTGDVIPFEAVPVQPVEPRLAWAEALSALGHFDGKAEAEACSAPADWPTLVATHEPEMALGYAVGNFPQMVRDLHGLMQADQLVALKPTQGRPLPVADLLAEAERALAANHFPQALVVLGALRLAKQFDEAHKLFERHEKHVPAKWKNAWSNERAALLWHQGRAEEAARLWKTLPKSAPTLFNRGMSALFLGDAGEARKLLAQAVELLPEESGWHHLARLYIALAEMRG